MSENEEDFAAMFEASIKTRRFTQGQTIEGTIVAIGPDVAFVDVGGKGEAVIEVAELKDDEGDIEVSVGDRIQAMVVSTAGGLTLSRALTRGAATLRQLEDAFNAGLPVEGKVEAEVKGGYEVRIARQRGFCPFSQIDTQRGTESITTHRAGLQVPDHRYKDGGRNLVVSRRALLEAEQRAQAAELRKSIVPGAVITGRVSSVRDFGAFVNLGAGVEGLLHVSEMGWSRVLDPSQVVTPGEEITVKILRIDDDGQKISLGLKQLSADPWQNVGATYEVGQVRAGRVTRIAEFGAFVELEPGVEGLAHASTFAPTGRANGWTKAVSVGMMADFEVLSVDLDKKRIGVALVPEGSARAADPAPEATSAPAAKPIARPERQTGPAAQEREDVREYAARKAEAAGEGFGSLADKLRGALKPQGK